MKFLKHLAISLALACSVVLAPTQALAASFGYDSMVHDAFLGNYNTSSTVKCALLGAGYTPSQTTHTRWSDLSANEVSGTGYTAGGNTVTVTYTKDTVNHRLTIAFPSTTWPTSTITARYGACYVSTGTASTSPLLFLDDFGSAVSSSGGTFTLNASTINVGTPQ